MDKTRLSREDLVGRLAGGLAHELNNALTVILGYSAHLLDHRTPPETVQSGLREIHRAGERAAALIEDLLAYSGRRGIRPTAFDLNHSVVEAVSSIQRRLTGTVDLVVDYHPGTVLVRADPDVVPRVLTDLLLFLGAGACERRYLTLRTGRAEPSGGDAAGDGRVASPEGWVELAVRGADPALDQESHARLFEPFYSTVTLGRGSGLGLAAAHGIVTRSGGRLSAEPAPEGGTRFLMSLPCAGPPAAADGDGLVPGGR